MGTKPPHRALSEGARRANLGAGMLTGSRAWLATHLVAPDSLLAALAVMRARGHDPEPAKRAGKLAPDFESSPRRISFLAAREVWLHAIRVCRDPALGIAAAEHYLRRDLNLVGYLIRTSPTLAQGLRDKARFAPVEDELCRCTWVETEEIGTFVFGGSAEFYLPAVSEFAAARLVGAVRWLSGCDLSPLAVRFMHDAPSATAAHRAFFRSPLQFGAGAFEVVFPIRALRRPTRDSDPVLYALLQDYAEQKLAYALRPRAMADRIRDLIRQFWQRGQGEIPSRAQLARTLRVTPRTLSRWLEADGKTYSDVLDEFRALAAMRTLRRPDVSLVQLAQMLGFKDQSAFTHAFRRWTGMTPGQYRRLHADAEV